MKSWTTKNGNEIFQVSSGRSNSYYIINKKLNILADTGMFSTYREIKRNISIINPATKLDFLILTHTHFDHCQNAARLKNEYDCKIIMSEYEKDFVKDGYTPVPKGTMFFSKIIYGLGIHLDNKRFSYDPFTPDILVQDEFKFIRDGLDISILETPGHSSGSISIIIDHDIAIVGDTLFGIFPNSVYPPFADNPNELIKSWQKLLQTGCRVFLPGHGKEIKRKLLNSKLRS